MNRKIFALIMPMMCLLLVAALPADAQIRSAVDINYGPSSQQKLDIWWNPSNPPGPIVFLIHGGGWRSGDKATYSNAVMASIVTGRGGVLVSTNYRLIGSVDEPTPEEVLKDVWIALAWMRRSATQYNADPGRIVVGGSSAGSHLSAALAYGNRMNWLTGTPFAGDEAAMRESIRGYYADSCALDFSQATKEKHEELQMSFGALCNPISELDSGEAVALLTNGDRDRATPLEGVQDFALRGQSLGIPMKIIVIPGGEHMTGTRMIFRDTNDGIGVADKTSVDPALYERLRDTILADLGNLIELVKSSPR